VALVPVHTLVSFDLSYLLGCMTWTIPHSTYVETFNWSVVFRP